MNVLRVLELGKRRYHGLWRQSGPTDTRQDALFFLSDEDKRNRVQFAHEMLEMKRQDPSFFSKIFWTDECNIRIGDPRSTSGIRFYSKTNPHFRFAVKHSRQGVMVWVAISPLGTIGPRFLVTTVTGRSYRYLLDHHFFPQAEELAGGEDYWFQHDGASVHYAETVVRDLNNRLPGRWIGRGGQIRWPPRSPDLSPLDFCFWSALRKLVLAETHNNIDELMDSVRRHVAVLGDIAAKACLGVEARLRRCIRMKGESVDK